MDDWNDFGTVLPTSADSFASSPDPPYGDSSRSTLDTYSDSSAVLYDGTTRPSSSHRVNRAPTAQSGASPPSSTQPTSRSSSHQPSFLSAIPFVATARQRRADRAAAAAAAALAAANANAVTSPNAQVDLNTSATDILALPDSPPVSALPNGNALPVTDDRNHDVLGQQSSLRDPARLRASHSAPVSATDDLAESISASSGSDGIEPQSVMMAPSRRPPNNPLGEDDGIHNVGDLDNDADENDSPVSGDGYTPRRGDLDDVPDDYELNIEGFRFTAMRTPNSLSDGDGEPSSSPIASSLLRPIDKLYTKLEVISARQIRSLLIFFSVFVIISVAYTLFILIVSNTVYKKVQSVPLPETLLTEEQRQNGVGPIPFPPTESSSPERRLERTRGENICQCQPPDRDKISNVSSYAELLSLYGLCIVGRELIQAPPCKLEKRSSVISSKQASSTSQPPSPPFGDVTFSDDTVLHYVVPVTIVLLPVPLKATHLIFAVLLALFFIILAILYGLRLVRMKRRNITHEQIWAFILLLLIALYLDFFENILDLYQLLHRGEEGELSEVFSSGLLTASDIFESVRASAFITFSFFYLWANFHSYRILDPTQRLRFTTFYLPKLLILVPHLIFHISIHHALQLELSDIPLISAPAMAFIFAPFRIMSYLYWEMILAIIKTLWDLTLVCIIFYEAVKTMRVLEQAPHMKHRAKRVGFRFFLYINFVFYTVFYILYWILLFGRPVGDVLVRISLPADSPRAKITFVHTAGLWFLLVGYVLSIAFVHLPYTSVGWFTGWFRSAPIAVSGSKWSSGSSIGGDIEREKGKPQSSDSTQPVDSTLPADSLDTKSGKFIKAQNETWSNDYETPVSIVDNDSELQQQIIEPITYRKRESKDSLELKANCFTMQTHVIMFNFAWYVYYYGTPKLDKFRPRENPLPFEFVVDRHVISAATDTQALVLDCTDRIIVTFKGTTSMKNLRTSLKVNHDWLRSVVRLNADGEDESERMKKIFGSKYLRAKIHQGFSTAYMSVMDEVVDRVRRLRAKKFRPVFLTGHSLGGALATICSLDLWVKLNISRREIFVSTFGSPRVGNAYFAAVYSEVVPLHWRIVVDPDMIARLPRVGYVHVGKKVVLTPHGEMIIDPNALEHRPWSGETAGFAYHRKASYLLAMRAWCVRNHGMTYTPVFWPFPVRPEDERRFAGAFDHEEDSVSAGRKVAQKIIRMDAMVDALGDDGKDMNNMAAVERWARLTRRILLNEKLGGG